MTKMLRNMGVAKCHFGDRAFSGDDRFLSKGFCHPRHPQIMLDRIRPSVRHRDLQQGQGRDLQHRVPVRLPDHRNNSRLIDRLPSILLRMATNLGLHMLLHARLNLRLVPPRHYPYPYPHPNACLPHRYPRCHRWYPSLCHTSQVCLSVPSRPSCTITTSRSILRKCWKRGN
jgi:hypothetical protein